MTRKRLSTLAVAVLTVFLSIMQPVQARGHVVARLPSQADGGRTVALRVLVLSVGTPDVDPGLDLIDDLLDNMGVPYDVFDTGASELTEEFLRDGHHGRYNGIILTQSEMYLSTGHRGFSREEWGILHDYERNFGVRESVISGFPATSAVIGLDYGMATIASSPSAVGRWVSPAGGTEFFEYVNTSTPLAIKEFSFSAVPRNDAWSPEVMPLLVDKARPGHVLLSIVRYQDGREVLLSTVNNAWFQLHSQIMAYEFVKFATKGLFIGAREAYLSIHNDDLFLADEVWNPETNDNWPEEERNYRLVPADIESAVKRRQVFLQEHPMAGDLFIEMAFNGVGSRTQGGVLGDPLSASIVKNAQAFRFINHTYQAFQMDRLCPDPDEAQLQKCKRTDYWTAYNEVISNRSVWRSLRLPEYRENLNTLLTDSHSGLHDRKSTPSDPTDDIVYPAGRNRQFLRAIQRAGVRFLASDSSQVNQDQHERIPGSRIILLPRYPTAVFYNTTTPNENTSEYNYIHHYRYVKAGQDPCTLQGAVCVPRTYEEILDAEAETTLRHILSFKAFPHYFHQVNLRDYDGLGNSLQFDWLESVMSAYERYLTLPLRTPLFYEVGKIVETKLAVRDRKVSGELDLSTGLVRLWADAPIDGVKVTGLADGELYGGDRTSVLSLKRRAVFHAVDQGAGV